MLVEIQFELYYQQILKIQRCIYSGNNVTVSGRYGVFRSGNISSQNVNYANYLAQIITEDKLPPRFRAYSQNTSDHRNADTTCLENGFYWVNAGTLPPNVGDADIITVNANSSYGHQLAFKFSGGGTTGSSYDGKDLYTRIYSNGSWLPWYTILTSGNYTSYCATAGHTHSYVPLAGGTMTNTLSVCGTGENTYPNGAPIEIREASHGGSNISHSLANAPRIGFHWRDRYWMNLVYYDSWLRVMNSDMSGYTGIISSGFYHSSYASSAYALTSDGGAAHIGSMSVNYANSAGSVSWSNVTSKPAATGNATTPVYWNGSGFTNCTSYGSASVNYANSAGSVAWANVTDKPDTATRWPSWSEVTNKPEHSRSFSFTTGRTKAYYWLTIAESDMDNYMGTYSYGNNSFSLSIAGSGFACFCTVLTTEHNDAEIFNINRSIGTDFISQIRLARNDNVTKLALQIYVNDMGTPQNLTAVFCGLFNNNWIAANNQDNTLRTVASTSL